MHAMMLGSTWICSMSWSNLSFGLAFAFATSLSLQTRLYVTGLVGLWVFCESTARRMRRGIQVFGLPGVGLLRHCHSECPAGQIAHHDTLQGGNL